MGGGKMNYRKGRMAQGYPVPVQGVHEGGEAAAAAAGGGGGGGGGGGQYVQPGIPDGFQQGYNNYYMYPQQQMGAGGSAAAGGGAPGAYNPNPAAAPHGYYSNYYCSEHPDARRQRNGLAALLASLAALFVCCWCVTWPCHGPCCCGC
jgi:hypothetical protein